MDQKINAYLDSLVSEVLSSPAFATMPADQQATWSAKVREFLNGVIIDTVIDRLTPEQLNAIKDIPADSPEMEDKIEEYSAQIPLLAQELEEKLTQAALDIKQNPQVLR